MSKQKKIILGVIMIATLLMATGYAALQSIELTINGTAKASANADNFKVYFTGEVPLVSDEANVKNAEATSGDINATVDFEGLDTLGQSAYAVFEIENGSKDIDAESVKVTLHDTDTNYFDISAEMCDKTGKAVTNPENPVAAGAKTYVKVIATLKSNPISDNTTTNITVKVVATPDTAA